MTEQEIEQIAILSRHPAFGLLAKALEEEREKQLGRLTRTLIFKHEPLDQRVVDEMRGFWRGAMWVAEKLPEMQYDRWMEAVGKAMEEGDEEWLKRFVTL